MRFLIFAIVIIVLLVLYKKFATRIDQEPADIIPMDETKKYGPYTDKSEIYCVEGNLSTALFVYNDKVQIKDILSGNSTTIPYSKIYAVTKCFDSMDLVSYLKFDDGRSADNSIKPWAQSNCFPFSKEKTISDDKKAEIIQFINKKIAESASLSKEPSYVSAADEIKKFKELYDMGTISEEEFDAKKKQLLGL